MSKLEARQKGRLDNFIPPEGVPITFDLASRGSRLGAQLLDILLTYGGVFLLLVFLGWTSILSGHALTALFLLLTFFVRIPYYIFAELIWNGRTIGKRITKIRVISADGRRLTPHQIVARNLMKEVEVFLPITTVFAAEDLSSWAGLSMAIWVFLVLLIPFFNRSRQRLGDMIADTLVVEMPKAVLLPDLADISKQFGPRFVFDPEHLGVYGRYELQTLEQILRDPPKTQEHHSRVHDIARTIIRKIGYTEKVTQVDEWNFLMEFYKQQRGFLENRHMFGDSRRDKFHTDAAKMSQASSEKTNRSKRKQGVPDRSKQQS